jgi:hypothetical protein
MLHLVFYEKKKSAEHTESEFNFMKSGFKHSIGSHLQGLIPHPSTQYHTPQSNLNP